MTEFEEHCKLISWVDDSIERHISTCAFPHNKIKVLLYGSYGENMFDLFITHNCKLHNKQIKIIVYEKNMVYTINELSKKYYMFFTQGHEWLYTHMGEINNNDNIVNIDTFMEIYNLYWPCTKTVKHINSIFFGNPNNAYNKYVGQILEQFGDFLNNLYCDRINTHIFQEFMNDMENYDIPYSKEIIYLTIRLCIEIPHVHKYGYDMNAPEFINLYSHYGFYPESYNIDMELVNKRKKK